MLAALVVLLALAGQSPREPEIIVVAVEKSAVVLTVYPPKGRTVTAVRLQQHFHIADPINHPELVVAAPQPAAPRAITALTDRGLRATFDNPQESFHITIALDDGSTHLVDDHGRRMNSTTPRRVESRRLTPLGVKTY